MNMGFSWGGGAPTRFYRGTLDEVHIFNRALTAAEVQGIQTAGSAGLMTNYSATINWGDGNTSPSTIYYSAGTFTVVGNHTYAAGGAQAGNFFVTIDHGTLAINTPATSLYVNTPPVANTGGPYLVYSGSGVTLDATRSSDPDSATASFTTPGTSTTMARMRP